MAAHTDQHGMDHHSQPHASQIDGQQLVLEECTRQALITLAQTLQAAQVAAFKQVRSQLSRVSLENAQLHEQLGDGALVSQGKPRPGVEKPELQMFLDAANSQSVLKPVTPRDENSVIDFVEAFTLPNALVSQTFTEKPPSRGEAWKAAGGQPAFKQSDCSGGKPEATDVLAIHPQKCRTSSIDITDGNCDRLGLTKPQPGARARQSRISMANIKSQRISCTDLDNSDGKAELQQGSLAALRGSRKSNKSRLFPNKTDLMARVQKNVAKVDYKVSDFYYQQGWPQRIATNAIFEAVTLGVIFTNSIWIAIDTDYNTQPLDPDVGFVVVENLFCAYFTMEVVIRYLAFERKRNCLRDFWFVFDSTLVTVAVLETWVFVIVQTISGVSTANLTGQSSAMLRLLRMARLARTARMVRLLRAVPELMIMFKGMAVASHAVICTLFLLAIIIYVFGLSFRQLTTDTALGQTHFRSVPVSMATLLLRGAIPDFGDFVYDLGDTHLLLATFGMCFVFLSMLMVLNMLSGLLVNVVLVIADLEKEEADAVFVRNALPVLIDFGDTDGDQTISKSEFDQLLTNPDATMLLEQVNIDIMGLVELSDFIFMDDDDRLNFEDFFKLLLKLRGSNTATVKDLVEMRKFVIQELGSLEGCLGSMLEQVLAKLNGNASRL